MRNNIFIAIFFLTILTSCKSSLKKKYEIKDPKIETELSIKSFLNSKKIDTSNVYIFKSLMTYSIASQKKLLSVPDAIFYNKEGNFVNYKKSASDCNGKIDSFLSDLKSFSEIESDETNKIDNFIKFLKDGDKIKKNLKEVNVFITWAIFTGKLNEEKAFEWIRLINDAKKQGVSINYFLVNCDFQEVWKLTDEQIKSLNIND